MMKTIQTQRSMNPLKTLAGILSRDPLRVPINGVHVTGSDGVAVATNGHVLVHVPYNGELALGTYTPRGGIIEAQYPDYKSVLPDWTATTMVPLGDEVILRLQEVVALNKRDGVRAWNPKAKTHACKHAAFTAARFKANSDWYYFDPFQLMSAIDALRKSGYRTLTLCLKDPLTPARIATTRADACGVIMPVRAGDRYLTVSN